MPSFQGKGKIRPIKLMKSHERFIEAFKNLGETKLDNTAFEVIEEFVCHFVRKICSYPPTLFSLGCKTTKMKMQSNDL